MRGPVHRTCRNLYFVCFVSNANSEVHSGVKSPQWTGNGAAHCKLLNFLTSSLHSAELSLSTLFCIQDNLYGLYLFKVGMVKVFLNYRCLAGKTVRPTFSGVKNLKF